MLPIAKYFGTYIVMEINGAYGEGGGQIIRTSLSLAAITNTPIHIKNIRAARNKKGLQPQHLTACLAVKEICDGILVAEKGSTDLYFEPGRVVPGNYDFDIGTAGSVVLVAQTLIPILIMQNKKSVIRIVGGTHVRKSPSFDYLQQVFLPAISKFGAKVNAKLLRAGFYRAGGGIIELEIFPSELFGCTKWQRDNLGQGIIRISRLPRSIAEREEFILLQNGIEKITIIEDKALSPGNAITLWKGLNGSYLPGERGKLAETVAQEAVNFLQKQTAEVDCHLADQLIIYAFLSQAKTIYETSLISKHLETNLHFTSLFLPRKSQILNKKVIIE